MDETSSKVLFEQVRVAHRLLAAYYQRIQHVIKEVTDDDALDLRFSFWRPTRFSRPLRRSGNQLRKWSWDLLPGVQTEYLFAHDEKESEQPGSWVLRVHVVTDTGVANEKSAQNPLEIKTPPESAESVVRFYILAPRKYIAGRFYGGVQKELVQLDCSSEKVTCLNDEKQIYAVAFQVQMEDLTAKDSEKELIDKIMVLRDEVLGESVVSIG